MAIEVWNALCDGNGGMDWGGLQLLVELYGIEDVEGLVMRLKVIKAHKPPQKET